MRVRTAEGDSKGNGDIGEEAKRVRPRTISPGVGGRVRRGGDSRDGDGGRTRRGGRKKIRFGSGGKITHQEAIF